jgi:hypothetical protein
MDGFEVVDQVPVDADRGRVYEHGWQSLSPTTAYRVGATSYRPVEAAMDRGQRIRRSHSSTPATCTVAHARATSGWRACTARWMAWCCSWVRAAAPS